MRFSRRERRSSHRIRLLYATDLHGSELVFRKFLNAVTAYEANVAVLGGDLTGKRLVPLIETEQGLIAEVAGARDVATSEEEIGRLVARIRDLGQYPVRLREEEYAELSQRSEAIESRFLSACEVQVQDWMERAAERLEPLGVPLFVTGGNDDYLAIETILHDTPYVVNAEGRRLEIANGIEMISTGYGNETPWHCPRDISEEELAERIDAMARELLNCGSAIFNLHVPPLGSGLDRCARLDTSVDPPKPIVGEEMAAGSSAVSDAIHRFKPMLSLHGHIHESAGIRRIGPTTCINPGSEYGEGILRSAVIDLEEAGTVRSAQLLTA